MIKAVIKDPLARANKTERAYGQHLEDLARIDRIYSWGFQTMRLRLADGTFYTPDFIVVNTDDTIEIHETKGFMREAARVRLKVANELHPFTFFVVKKGRAGWELTNVSELR